jgi:hypothetical protein
MSASADLARVARQRVPEVWPLVADRLRAAYLRTDLEHTSSLENDVLHAGAMLWIAGKGSTIEAAAVSKLVRTNRNLVCVITACGGADMSRWLSHIETIEGWARTQGAAKIRLYGRKGWARKLKNYLVSNVVLERLL